MNDDRPSLRHAGDAPSDPSPDSGGPAGTATVSEPELEALAQALAACAECGDAIALRGPLGAQQRHTEFAPELRVGIRLQGIAIEGQRLLVAPLPRQHRAQISPRMACRVVGNIFRCPHGHDLAAAIAALGAEIEQPVGRLDDVEIVLDHHHGVARLDQFVQHLQQLAHILEM